MTIPFTIDSISGILQSVDLTTPHKHFHVIVNGYYKGQLMWNEPMKKCWLPDSELGKYERELGEFAEGKS